MVSVYSTRVAPTKVSTLHTCQHSRKLSLSSSHKKNHAMCFVQMCVYAYIYAHARRMEWVGIAQSLEPSLLRLAPSLSLSHTDECPHAHARKHAQRRQGKTCMAHLRIHTQYPSLVPSLSVWPLLLPMALSRYLHLCLLDFYH